MLRYPLNSITLAVVASVATTITSADKVSLLKMQNEEKNWALLIYMNLSDCLKQMIILGVYMVHKYNCESSVILFLDVHLFVDLIYSYT